MTSGNGGKEADKRVTMDLEPEEALKAMLAIEPEEAEDPTTGVGSVDQKGGHQMEPPP